MEIRYYFVLDEGGKTHNIQATDTDNLHIKMMLGNIKWIKYKEVTNDYLIYKYFK